MKYSAITVSLLAALTAAEAFAQTAAAEPLPPQPGFTEVLFNMLPMFAMVFLIFYFMVLKPQQTKLRTQQDLISGLKKGETVVTSGGIIGRIVSVEDDSVHLEVSQNVKIRVEKNHVAKKHELKQAEQKSAA